MSLMYSISFLVTFVGSVFHALVKKWRPINCTLCSIFTPIAVNIYFIHSCRPIITPNCFPWSVSFSLPQTIRGSWYKHYTRYCSRIYQTDAVRGHVYHTFKSNGLETPWLGWVKWRWKWRRIWWEPQQLLQNGIASVDTQELLSAQG